MRCAAVRIRRVGPVNLGQLRAGVLVETSRGGPAALFPEAPPPVASFDPSTRNGNSAVKCAASCSAVSAAPSGPLILTPSGVRNVRQRLVHQQGRAFRVSRQRADHLAGCGFAGAVGHISAQLLQLRRQFSGTGLLGLVELLELTGCCSRASRSAASRSACMRRASAFAAADCSRSFRNASFNSSAGSMPSTCSRNLSPCGA